MRRIRAFVFAGSTLILSCLSGCITEPAIDADKFAELERTAQEMSTALESRRSCDMPEDLEQQLASGIAALRDRLVSKAERDLAAAYALLLVTYRDGLLLCRSRGHLASLELIPEGRIFLTQELDPIVKKYDLASEKHVYRPTGQHMRSIEGSAIEVIWDRALAQIKNAENILHYH